MFILSQDGKRIDKKDVVENFSMEFLKENKYKWGLFILSIAILGGVYYYYNKKSSKKNTSFFNKLLSLQYILF